MKLKINSFGPGGVKINRMKLTLAEPIEKSHIPHKVVLPMLQHRGRPAKLAVEAGQNVEEGQVIGEAAGPDSAFIHASVSGKVVSIDKMKGYDGLETDAVSIMTGGTVKNWYGKKYESDNLAAEEMLALVRQAGVVGFDDCIPAHVKLAPVKGRPVNTLIINGVESSPYITAGHRIMIEKTDDLVRGIRIIMKITGAHEALVAVEADNEEAAGVLSGKLAEASGIKIAAVSAVYPSGGERQLVKSLLGREVPAGLPPSGIGVIVEDVSTVLAVYEAVAYKKPLIERCITYTGNNVEKRGNYKIRIGTPVSHITSEFGMPEGQARIIAGGVMTGYDTKGRDMPVTKGISGIVILPRKTDYRVRDLSCIRCSRCLSSCPARLNPSLLSMLCREDLIEEAVKNGLNECIECGCCSYMCPSAIPAAALLRYGKNLAEALSG